MARRAGMSVESAPVERGDRPQRCGRIWPRPSGCGAGDRRPATFGAERSRRSGPRPGHASARRGPDGSTSRGVRGSRGPRSRRRRGLRGPCAPSARRRRRTADCLRRRRPCQMESTEDLSRANRVVPPRTRQSASVCLSLAVGRPRPIGEGGRRAAVCDRGVSATQYRGTQSARPAALRRPR
jgi:hypothetical protein